ncbi:MAG TPA: hypothetical protein VFF89_11730 [Sphingobium sp.]|nr:hypothetical protein [Sphingobium sp.]
MRLVALLNARAPAAGEAASAFTADELRIGVHSPVEHQARQAIAAGADLILIRADQPLGEAARTAERLSRESGVPVLALEDGPDLARRLEPDDRVLLIAERMILPQQALDDLLGLHALALLATPSENATAHLERIDARHVWAGAALLSGEILLATIDMLGEWDLELTLLRRAVQQGARRIELPVDFVTSARVMRIGTPADAQQALEALTRSGFADAPPRDPLTALLAPVGSRLVEPLARYQVNPAQIRWAAGLLSVFAIAGASADWPRLGLLFALLAEAALGLSDACARVMLHRPAPMGLRVLVKGAGLTALAILGGRLANGDLLALLGVALALALVGLQTIADLRDERPVLGRLGLWRHLSTGMALTIGLGGALGNRVPHAFVLIGLYAFGTVAVRLLAKGDNRI